MRSPLAVAKPLKTRECADYMGVSLDFVYGLIQDGTLKAEHLVNPRKTRGVYMVHQDDFIACLKKLKWSRIPKIERTDRWGAGR